MLPTQFLGQNLHFAISLFAALVFFAVFWLYFDAWLGGKRKKNKGILNPAGFLLVSLSFVVQATVIDQSALGQSVFGNANGSISTVLRLIGFIIIIIAQVTDPLQAVPMVKSLEDELAKRPTTSATPALAVGSSWGFVYALPLGALTIAVLYWRRATKGLEHHLRPVALAFALFFGFELLSLAGLARNTTNPNLYNLVKAFGPLWMASYIFLLAGSLVLGRWVWHYLTERFMSQLFMILTSSVLIIFLLTTVSFTSLLMRNVQNDTLDNLQTASNVLSYALDSKKAQTGANAEVIAQNPLIAQAISSKDHKALVSLTSGFLQAKKQSTLDITDSAGRVLLRAQDPEHWGDSVSSDTLVRRALIGRATSSLSSTEGVLAPIVYIKSSVPVLASDGSPIGTVTFSLIADSTLVDGIKNATGLDSAIYSNNVLSATTFLAPDGKSRLIGVKTNNGQINNKVLKQGQVFKGELNILNRPYLAVYSPLKDADNSVVGMLFIGQPQVALLKTAARSIELTFLVSVILLVAAIIPAYFVAKYLARQLD
jgi:hypothetical protein